MKSISEDAEGHNCVPTAKRNDVTAPAESAYKVESISDGSVGEEQQLHEADKCHAKIHYLSRTIAREHGIIPATIIGGLAYKLKYHRKNKWKDRWWYYDPIETLRTHRWPYLSDGCICENIDYLVQEKLLIKDCNNKLSLDRTSWYAMEDSVLRLALSDLVWFDVPVAKKCGILAGLIYHNLRYHLRKQLQSDPIGGIPFHKLRKAQLARVLPMSVSTAKRVVKEMVDAGIILPHGTKRGFFTLADQRELFQNGSSTNANGSSTNGSSANAISSTANANGSKVNANGSSANDYTQYETNKKPFGNQSQKGVSVCDSKTSFGVEKTTSIHDKDHDTVGSVAVPAEENTKPCPGGSDTHSNSFHHTQQIRNFEQIIQQTSKFATLLASLDEKQTGSIQDLQTSLCSHFITQHLSATLLEQLWGTSNRDQLGQALASPFAEYVINELDAIAVMSPDTLPLLTNEQIWSLLYYPQLETLVRAFATHEVWSGIHTHTMPHKKEEVFDAHCELLDKLEGNSRYSPEFKCTLLKQFIQRSNRYGWELRDESRRTNAVQPTASAFKKVEALFTQNPQLTPKQMLNLLGECLDIIYLGKAPEKDGFDKYWHARQGRNLDKFIGWIGKIVQELDAYDQCPVGAA